VKRRCQIRCRFISTSVREDNLKSCIASWWTAGEGEILFLPTRIIPPGTSVIAEFIISRCDFAEGRESVGASGTRERHGARARAVFFSFCYSFFHSFFPASRNGRRNPQERERRFSVSLALSPFLSFRPSVWRFKRETADSRPFNRVAEPSSREASRWLDRREDLVVYVPHDQRR